MRTPVKYSMPMRLASNCSATSNNRMRQENRIGRARVFFASQTSIKQRFGLPSVGKERLCKCCGPSTKPASAFGGRAPPCFWPTQAISCVGIYFGIYFRSLLRNCSAACALTLYSGVHQLKGTFYGQKFCCTATQR